MRGYEQKRPWGTHYARLLALFTVMAGCDNPSADTETAESTQGQALEQSARPIKVGLLAPFSGPFAEYGPQFLGGIKTRIAQKSAGDSAPKVEIVFKDTTGPNPELGQRLAQELIVQDKVDFLAIGGFTPETLTGCQVASRAKIPCLVLNASSTDLLTKLPFGVRTSFSFRQISKPLGEWAGSQGYKRVMTLVTDYGPGLDAEGAFRVGVEEQGGEVTNALRIPLRSPDFAPFLQRVKDEKPEALLAWVPQGEQATTLLKGFHERGLDKAGIHLLVLGDLLDPAALRAGGDSLVDTPSSLHYSLTHDSDLNRTFVQDFATHSGLDQSPSFMAVAAYDGIELVYRALEKHATGAEALAAMTGLDLESPRGPIHIDKSTRDITQSVYIRKTVKEDGALRNSEVKTFEKLQP